MKKLSLRQLKELENIFENAKLHEKNRSFRKYYDEIHFNLKMIAAYLYGAPYYSIKEIHKKGWNSDPWIQSTVQRITTTEAIND